MKINESFDFFDLKCASIFFRKQIRIYDPYVKRLNRVLRLGKTCCSEMEYLNVLNIK